ISSGSQTITVTLPNHGFTTTQGLFQQFIAPTTVGVASAAPTIVQGKYQIISVISSNQFTINAATAASTTAQATMNSPSSAPTVGRVQLKYYVPLGPTIAGSGFGAGGFGGVTPTGGFGTGAAQTGTAGSPITATDWTSDNWGDVLLACPEDGAIYAWAPS